jgi:carboxymethylenebutenolidase
VTGFCWGGRIVWLYAAHGKTVKAGTAWYGGLVGTPVEIRPKSPIDLVGALNAPVLGLYAGKDGGIPLDSVEKMREALKGGSAAARASEIVVYPDAQHGFNADYRPTYNKADANDGWARMLAWFKKNGVA